MLAVIPVYIQEVINSYVMDSTAQQLLQKSWLSTVQMSRVIHWWMASYGTNGKICVRYSSAVQTKIIQAMHCSALGGHSGIQAQPQG
jgi:hypothetical protein